MQRLRECLREQEGGQTLIFVAVIGSVLMGIMGLAVEGGQVFVEYRHMQAAADMAALVGAQKLPCTLGDTTCYNKVETVACNYAQLNGYGGGYTSGSTCATSTKSTGVGSSTISVNAYVPPNTCSPYKFVDYGASHCTTSNTNIYYDEVQIQEPMTVPIFNLTFTLSAHAVAKEGVASPTDFAVSVLNPNDSQALKMGGSGNVVVVGDSMSNGGIDVTGGGGGTAQQISCDGSWFTAYSQSVPNNNSFESNLSGQPYFADASCNGGTTLQPASFFPDSPLIPDPYGSTPPPPSSMSNCADCSDSNAYYYTWSCKNDLTSQRANGTWSTAADFQHSNMNGQNCYELWPGIYPYGIDDTAGATIFWNPGVYTFKGDVKTNGSAQQCIFGAPACDRLDSASPTIPGTTGVTCSNATFQQNDPNNSHYVAQETWYYYCSPWGIWDPHPPAGTNGPPSPGPSSTPPTFYDSTGATTYPMNGVTFYMQSGNFDMEGSGSLDVAFPNGCPGTGSGATVGSVPFQADPLGEPNGQTDYAYTYATTSLPYLESPSTQYSTSVAVGNYKTQVYPSGDLTLTGDQKCNNGLTTWKGEFPNKVPYGQHLQFIVFADNSSTALTLNGASEQMWWGILHTFPQNYSGYPGPPTGSGCGSCSITFTGSGGGSGGGNTVYGPPMLEGQVVTGTADFSGNSAVQIFYRPCRANTAPCGTGPGTGLVQ